MGTIGGLTRNENGLRSEMKGIKMGTQLGKQIKANMALEPIMFLKLRVINILNVLYSKDVFPKDRIRVLKE